ncbi:hypothetical protein WA026_009436 [Henosepilachna vigintioctopunctata]|uniref:Metallo-beta-lactamase domain-containing protein 1 n=1 Tax=Henosepilachna vigintioctopunctata TaxID=420089 RepID=A0AAW1TVP2_9CUCU
MYDVIVLFDGYSENTEMGSCANCSCVLLKGKDNIIVDTLTPWDGEKLQQKLWNNDINCEDIKYVVCTHGHSDHTGCNYLFSNAKLIVGFSISSRDLYFDHDFAGGKPYIINEFVKVIPTPGHTLEDVSVIVETKDRGLVAITGDLFEKEQDLSDDSLWKSVGSGHDDMQQENRNKILKQVDWIVPGHGPMFKVPDHYK